MIDVTAAPPDVRKRLRPSVMRLEILGAEPPNPLKEASTAGQSHRLTSGGEAVETIDLN